MMLLRNAYPSQAEIARQYGVTRACVSKIICEMKDDLGLTGRANRIGDGLTYSERVAKLRERL
jgi:biotin operon repressor